MISPSFAALIPKFAAFSTRVIPLAFSASVSCNSEPVKERVSIPEIAAIDSVISFVSELLPLSFNTDLWCVSF